MEPNDEYTFPDHPLFGVPQEVLDAARGAMATAIEAKDVDAEQAEMIADVVVIECLPAIRRWLT